MKKKNYVKPSIVIFELKQEVQLLQTSGQRDPYGDPNPLPFDI